MIKFLGKEIRSICLLTTVVSLLITPAPCWSQSIIQFWYADINDVANPNVADIRMPGGVYGKPNPVKPDEINSVNNYGNTIRGSAMPPGTNLGVITWDPTLANEAQKRAEKCESTQGRDNEILIATTKSMSLEEAFHQIQAKCQNRKDLCSKSCREYSMLMTAGLEKYGCAKVHCPDTALPYRVLCILNPKDAVTKRDCSKPYDTNGKPCEKCPPHKNFCFNNLCASPTDKAEILKNNPSAHFACKKKCKNCGVKKDTANECSCQCKPGTSGPTCETGSLTAPESCGPCGRSGEICLNGGFDSGEATCKCLCGFEFVGARCEIPRQYGTGGTRLTFKGRPAQFCKSADCSNMVPSMDEMKHVVNEITGQLAKEINAFCRKNQANYNKCCGTGTLPTSGPTDYMIEKNLRIPTETMTYTADGKLEASVFATVPGNNGLCRKKTSLPTPMVFVPDQVIQEIVATTLNRCCNGVQIGHNPPRTPPGVSSTISVILVAI